MRNIIITTVGVVFLAGCSNPAQTSAGITAATDTGTCALQIAPAIVTVAGGSGNVTSKGIAAATVAVQAGTTSTSPCSKIAADIAAAIAAGQVTAPTPTATTPTTAAPVSKTP